MGFLFRWLLLSLLAVGRHQANGHSVGSAEKTGDTEVPVAGYQPDSSGFNTGDGSSWNAGPLDSDGLTSNANQASRFNIPLFPSYHNDSELPQANYQSMPEIQYSLSNSQQSQVAESGYQPQQPQVTQQLQVTQQPQMPQVPQVSQQLQVPRRKPQVPWQLQVPRHMPQVPRQLQVPRHMPQVPRQLQVPRHMPQVPRQLQVPRHMPQVPRQLQLPRHMPQVPRQLQMQQHMPRMVRYG